jgi:hypothetical protein
MYGVTSMKETIKTATHVFWIASDRNGSGAFVVDYRALNPKTGEPWQSKRVEHGADDVTLGKRTRPSYSTVELARQAVAWQTERFAKSRR